MSELCHVVVLVAAVALLCSCEGPAPGHEPRPALRRDVFASNIQPLLAERCANPSCHGDSARPFSLFATRKHRRDPRQTYLDAPLTDEELEQNFVAAALMSVGVEVVDEALLVRKPLAEQASTYHGGGAVLEAGGPGHVALRAWLAGGGAP